MAEVKRKIGVLIVSVLAVSVLTVSGVSARGNDSGSGTSGSTDDSARTTTTMSESTSPHDSPDAPDAPEAAHTEDSKDDSRVRTRVAELKHDADGELKDMRNDKKPASTVEARQKACSAREANLNNKIANYNRHAKRTLGAYNSVYTRLQSFQTANKLTIPTYDALVAEADAKKAAATTAVEALGAVSVNVDCTADDPAAAVATVKEATATTKNALREYRTAVKNVLVAIKTAMPDDNSDAADDSDSRPSTTSTTTKPSETN